MTFIEVATTNKEVRVINTDYITQIHITSSLVHIDILNTEGACWIDMSEWERIKPLLMPPAPTVAPALLIPESRGIDNIWRLGFWELLNNWAIKFDKESSDAIEEHINGAFAPLNEILTVGRGVQMIRANKHASLVDQQLAEETLVETVLKHIPQEAGNDDK